jgi:multisubunit Na+/H+ antiporter MnhC subunit
VPEAGAAMQMFEYVIVLISIVIGLALTHLMQGIAGLIQNPRARARIWWVHLVWVAYMFLSIVFWWWWEFQLQRIQTWSFPIYLFVVFYAFYLYLICAVLFPRDLEGYDGFKDYFLACRGWFFGLLIGWAAIDTVDTWIKGPDYVASLGATALIFNAVLILSSVVGMVVRRGAIQAIIAVGLLAYVVSGVLHLFNVVNFTV